MKTSRERAEEKRVEKLEQIREQVDSGKLIIRTMTEAERAQYPPRQTQSSGPKPRRY